MKKILNIIQSKWFKLGLLLLLTFLLPHHAPIFLFALTSTGDIAPTNNVSNTGVTNPANAMAVDAAYANWNAVNNVAVYNNFGFDSLIPLGSTILGITVKLGMKVTGAGVNHSIAVKLFNKSTLNGLTSSKSFSTGNTTLTTVTQGNAIDLWGTNWRDSDFINSNFTIQLTDSSHSVTTIDVDWITVAVEYIPPTITIRSKQSYTTVGDQTIPTIVAGDTIVFIGTVSDGDPVHRAVDAQPTVGGVSMTSVLQSTVSGQNNQVDISVLVAGSGGTSVTFHTNYHTAPAGFMGTIFVLQGPNTTTPVDVSNHAENTGAANPSVSLVTTVAGDLLLEGIAGNNTPTPNASQTSLYTGSGNASSFAVAGKGSPTATTNTEAWTMTSAAYAYGAVAIQPVVTAGPLPKKSLSTQQAVNRASYY